jgi:hypothetical protein
MGVGFTIDTPYKVSPFGISSVVSLVDDSLIEKMRKFYSEKFNLPYTPIEKDNPNARANRITSYLNLLEEISKTKFEEIKSSFNEMSSDFHKYLDMLPNFSELRAEYKAFKAEKPSSDEIKEWIHNKFKMGSIDVNIMTKLDRENYHNKELLPKTFNDAHAALKGFADSNLSSSVVLSAGLNPSLYAYFENFKDFYPDENYNLKKKIVLKVSDYRSALIQGKFLAKKGLWISEYRVESGLNCGGHSFVGNGQLLGPALEEFKQNRDDLQTTIHKLYIKALEKKGYPIPDTPLEISVTAQGGVGDSDEHNFLLDYYQMDSVGWGTPFMLVPEATAIDNDSLKLMENATEDDLYLSGISPLGVPFNNIKGNTQDIYKQQLIDAGKPGSYCPKEYAKIFKDDMGRPICTASSRYQRMKIEELNKMEYSKDEYKYHFDKIVDKSCVCIGLGNSALLANDIDTAPLEDTVSLCPGPNLAYFDKRTSLKEMVDHIYGRSNIINRNDRPHMFIKELQLYIDNLKQKIEDYKYSNSSDTKPIYDFKERINSGISYYKDLYDNFSKKRKLFKDRDYQELFDLEKKLEKISVEE